MANVTVINPFEVPDGKEDEALALWDKFADYFRKQPGYVSTRLHRAINPDARFHLINIAEWESIEHFQAALNNKELAEIAASGDDFPHFPGLYEVIRS